MADLLYKELSYKINGLLFKVDNLIGYGQVEKTYCNALEELLKTDLIPYKRELSHTIKINDKTVSRQYFDFLIDEKIVLEVKTGSYMSRSVIPQLFQYLKTSGLELGLIARFTKTGVQIKRVLNIRNSKNL